jgi:hypothetical protein
VYLSKLIYLYKCSNEGQILLPNFWFYLFYFIFFLCVGCLQISGFKDVILYGTEVTQDFALAKPGTLPPLEPYLQSILLLLFWR